MRKTIKKGFTLVELLVVIAIIAILSVVGIIGYLTFTQRARVSNDTTIVTELNRVLQAEHVNKTPNTMQEIVDEIKDAGFILTRLTPTTSKHHIIYDKESDRFYLVNDQMTIVGGECDGQPLNDKTWYHWKVIQSYSDVSDPNFSYYLGEMKDDEPSEGITICNGIDVGENKVKKIKYENTTSVKNDVVIRTNGGTLTVNAPNDTVSHYGFATDVNMNDVDDNCYNENGTIGRLIYSDNDGKIYFGDTAVVYCYMNTSTDTSANAEYSGVKAANAIVYTYVDSGEDAAKGYAAADNKEDVTVTDGIVEISTCFNHNEDYDIIYIGNDIYIICKCCGAFSRISTDANGTTTVESSEGIGTENQEHENNEFTAKNNSSLPITNAVATIGYTKYYSTLAAAVADAKDDDTITMLKNHTTAAQTFSKTLTLDLNGKAISGTGQLLTFNGTGSFTVKDSSINGSITGSQVAVNNTGTGTVIINGGVLTGNTYYGIYNQSTGKIIVNNGTVTGKYGIYNKSVGGNINVNGGEIRGGSKSGICCLLGKGDVIITGGTVTSTSDSGISFSANQKYNSTGQGSLIASGNASISGTYGIFSGNPSNITISGNTTVTGSSDYGIYLKNTTTSPASITINDSAKISSNSKYGVYVETTQAVNTLNINNNAEIKGLTYGVYDNNGVVNINGGTISGGTYGVVNTGTLTIEDGTIQANLYYGVSNSGTLNMNGGTIIGGTHESYGRGIYNTGTTTINGGTISMNAQTANSQVAIDNRKTLTMNGGNVISNVIGVYSTDSFTLASGTITGGTNGIQTFGTTNITGGEIHCENDICVNVAGGSLTIDNGKLYGAYGIYGQNNPTIAINGENVRVEALKCVWLNSNTATCSISAGTFVGGSEVCYAYEGFFTISGGTFTGGETQQEEITTDKHRYNLNCKDENYVAGTAGFTVTGGTFYQFDPTHNRAEGEWTNFSIDGYHSVYNDETGYYTVVKD